jgi:hypothetical protein
MVFTLALGGGVSQAAVHGVGGKHSSKTSDDYGGFALLLKGKKAQHVTNGAAGPNSSAATTFTVPSVTCGSSENSGIVAGSGIFSSVSNWVSAGGIAVGCDDGTPTYEGEITVNNNPTVLSFTPAPGDVVSTSVVIVPGETTVTVDDVTQGIPSQISDDAGMIGTYISNGVDAVRAPGVLPVPNFGVIPFSNTSINGMTVKKAHGKPISRKAGSVLQIKTGKLNKTGDGYTETFIHS